MASAFILLVALVRNNDPYAQWVVLAIGFSAAAAFAFGIPAVLNRCGSSCFIGQSAIERHDRPPIFILFALLHGVHVWEWRSIGKLRLTEESIGGQIQPILWVLDKEGKTLGCVGLGRRIAREAVAGWAEAQQRPFEAIGGGG
ncbi:MAG: hypothetical protein ACREIT_01205 [Tepidisphaeraceae bacterium]